MGQSEWAKANCESVTHPAGEAVLSVPHALPVPHDDQSRQPFILTLLARRRRYPAVVVAVSAAVSAVSASHHLVMRMLLQVDAAAENFDAAASPARLSSDSPGVG